MSEKHEVKKALLDKATASKILRVVPRHEGFHFYKGPGDDTGKVAVSLVDFADKIRSVDIRSINFHFTRQDFEKWMRNVLGDVELSRRISKIKRDSHGEKLRSEIIQTVKSRIEELRST